jgi:hypothetical protein
VEQAFWAVVYHWLLSATGLPFLKVLTTVGAFRRLPLSS